MRAWKVNIPAGRWMGGYVHTFPTKKKALAFINSWNTVEVNSGNGSVTFWRSGPTSYEPYEAPAAGSPGPELLARLFKF